MSSDCPPIFENSSATTFFTTSGGNGVNNTNESFDTTYYGDNQIDNLVGMNTSQNFSNMSYNTNATNTTAAMPESLHINDEIFFNNYQLSNQFPGGVANKLNYDEESTGNLSSSNSINNYSSHKPSASASSQSSFSSNSSTGVHSTFQTSATTTPKVGSMPQFGNGPGKHGRQNSSSIPIDQLTLLSLRTPSVSGPPQQQQQTPRQQQIQQQLAGIAQPSFMFDPVSNTSSPNADDFLQSPTNFSYSHAVAAAAAAIPTIPEERTINPRQLFTKLNTSMSSPSLSTLFTTHNSQQQQQQQQPQQHQHHQHAHYSQQHSHQQHMQAQLSPQQPQAANFPQALSAQISPTQPTVPYFMPQHTRSVSTPQFDFKVDDEFSQAISSWLNGGWVDGLNPEIVNPVKKNRMYSTVKGRRSSIQSQVHVPIIHQAQQQAQSQQQQQQLQPQPQSQPIQPIMDSMSYASTPNTSPTTSSSNSDDEDKRKKNKNKKRRKSTAAEIDPLATSPAISPTSTSDDKNAANSSAFPCMECDKQFKRSEHLKRHIRSVHSNIRPFHCKYCEKKFSRSDNLAQHLKTHYRIDAEGNSHVIINPSGNRREKKKPQ